jgi:hypothetical protein
VPWLCILIAAVLGVGVQMPFPVMLIGRLDLLVQLQFLAVSVSLLSNFESYIHVIGARSRIVKQNTTVTSFEQGSQLKWIYLSLRIFKTRIDLHKLMRM